MVVNLYGPVLRMVAELTKGDEAGFSDLVVKLRAIRAKIWQVAPNRTEALRRSMTDLARRLEQDKWQTAVELRTGSGELSLISSAPLPRGKSSAWRYCSSTPRAKRGPSTSSATSRPRRSAGSAGRSRSSP